MHRILASYDAPPADGRVNCVDEFGPLNLMPRKGKAWRPAGRPRRLRATYNRYGGVMHMLAAIAAHIHWRNAWAEPKTRFAPESPIRQWTDYPAKAA
ncbi:hypothetical protein ACWGN5_33685 [Streptomyces sp. NPDC055815]